MNRSMSPDDMFLIDDPQLSVDFAPNGHSQYPTYVDNVLMNFTGTLLGLNEILTRKRYAK